MAAGIPVIGAGYGALGERIRAYGTGWTIDPTDPEGIRVVIERLDRARDELVRVTREVLRVPLETVDDTAHRYAALSARRPRRRARDAPARPCARAWRRRAPARRPSGSCSRARSGPRVSPAALATLSSWPSGNSSMSSVDTR